MRDIGSIRNESDDLEMKTMIDLQFRNSCKNSMDIFHFKNKI